MMIYYEIWSSNFNKAGDYDTLEEAIQNLEDYAARNGTASAYSYVLLKCDVEDPLSCEVVDFDLK